MEDKFEEFRKAQEGTLEKSSSTEEKIDSVPTVDMDIEHKEVLDGSDMNELKRSKLLNMVLLVMVFVMISLFMFLFFTDRLVVGVENPFSKKSATVQEDTAVEEEKDEEVVVQEEYRLFKNTRDVLDSEGNVVDNQELTAKFYPKSSRFEMDVLNALGNGVVVEGTYVEDGDRIILSFERGGFGLETDGILEFRISSEDGSILEFSGSDFGDTLPDEGDVYLLY